MFIIQKQVLIVATNAELIIDSSSLILVHDNYNINVFEMKKLKNLNGNK